MVTVRSLDSAVEAHIVSRFCLVLVRQRHIDTHRSASLRAGSRKIGIVEGLRRPWAAEAHAFAGLVLDGGVTDAPRRKATEKGDDRWDGDVFCFHRVVGSFVMILGQENYRRLVA